MSTTKQPVKQPPVNYIDVIKDIEDFYTENSITVSALITSTTLKYKPLSVEQLKDFIELQLSAAKDTYGVLPGLEAVEKLNDVITGNSVDHKEKLLTSLSTLDRDAIVVQLRANVKKEAEITVGDDETLTINLDDVVKRIKKAKFPTDLKERTKTIKYKSGAFVIKLKLPSLAVDSAINTKFKRKVLPILRKGEKQVEKQADKILSNVYFLELYKYIESITVSDTLLDFRDLDNFDQNFMVLEKLPTQVVAGISEFMGDIRTFKDEIFFYQNEDDKQVPLDVDMSLFAGI